MSDARERPAGSPDPARVVADADVLAADLLRGGAARDALDHWRRHSWVELVATDELLADAEGVIADLTDASLAEDWRATVERWRVRVDQSPGDHPALASAHAGEAAHLLSFDERLRSAKTGATLRKYVDVSVKHPRAFARLFDPERLYPAVADGEYPGPDRDPRA
jgi:predicted nucleic acid-binding protein